MQKIIRVAIVILLVVVTSAIILSQTQLHQKGYVALPWNKPEAGAAAVKQEAITPTAQLNAIVAAPVNVPVATSAVITQVSPQDIERETVEHEKNREVLRLIERNLAKLTASSLAQNYLLLFQAIIYFLILVIIFSLLETVKKFADAAVRSADAAKISAEAASKAVEAKSVHTARSHNGNRFIMRRLRGNYQKR